MIRITFLVAATLTMVGCINWQTAYDSAARRDCATIVNADERQACNASVERNASDQRAEDRQC